MTLIHGKIDSGKVKVGLGNEASLYPGEEVYSSQLAVRQVSYMFLCHVRILYSINFFTNLLTC